MLADKYRPRTWAEVVGNEKAVKVLQRLAHRALETGDPLVALLSGPSGVGKSTCAHILARELGAHDTETTVIPSGECSIDRLRSLADDWQYSSLFGAKALIIEEINTATPAAVQFLLTFLERLPKGRVVVMTSNVRPDELFAGVYNSPFTSRAHCVDFTSQGLATRKGEPGPGALRVKRVMEQEGFDGKPVSYYVRIVNECHGNIRDAIHLCEREALAEA